MHAHTGGLARIVRACAEHPKRTFAIWVVAIAAIAVASGAIGGKLVNEFTIPGSDSQAARTLLQERFPTRAGDSARLVFSANRPLTTAGPRREIAAATRAAKQVPGVVAVGNPYSGRGGALAKDGRIGFVEVQFDKPASQVTPAQIHGLEDGVRNAMGTSPTTRVEFGGQVIEGVPADSTTSEALGLAAAVLVLLLVLGSAVAMAIPVTLALVAVGSGLSLLTLAAAFTNFNKLTPVLAVMIGLGVAIDYALFIVTRFRQSLADGEAPTEAAVTAGSTAGRAVIFAGTTVAISVSGLALVGIPFVTKLGLGSAMTVITAVCSAVTLLPAILAKVGHRIERGRLPLVSHERSGKAPEASWIARFGQLVTSHPKTALVASLGVLLTLATPALSMKLGTADAGTNPAHTTTRKAYDLLATGFGAGFNGPLLVVVDQKGHPGTSRRLETALLSTPDVARVDDPVTNGSKDTAEITVYPATSPQSTKTADLVHTLRNDVIPTALAGSGAHAYVGGATAINEDIAAKISGRMWMFLLFVVGITLLVLTMAFRSIVIAVKAALTTMLSALAAFGALVAVFQWGWLESVVGLNRTGPISSFLPVMILAILFGLSMDYEVFLASRIREKYVRGSNTRRAVNEGIGAVGRVIVAAATIMAVVFWAFTLDDDPLVKSFGLGLAVAILADALIVRMILVPAVMHLLGDTAWYMPRWLDWLLPRLTVEPPEATGPTHGRPGQELPQPA
jgi:RND superfamily putative drug exporter